MHFHVFKSGRHLLYASMIFVVCTIPPKSQIQFSFSRLHFILNFFIKVFALDLITLIGIMEIVDAYVVEPK
ncbi:hypothetical protein P8452_25092 [Trifolium repens]|nr:hypothetical protein P8452_25092 [Trifolium repens]